MRLAKPEESRYWEGSRSGTVVQTTTGTGSGKPRIAQKSFPDEAAAAKDLTAKLRAKLREGYVFRAEGEPGAGWDLRLFTHVSRWHTGFLSADFSARDGLIAVGRPSQTTDESICELLLIDAATASVRTVIPLKAFDLWQVRFDPRSPGVFVRTEGLVVWVDPATQERRRFFATPPFTFLDFHLSRDGRRLFGSDHSQMVVIDVDSGTRLLEVPLEELADHERSRAGALSPSGRMAALSQEPGKIELFDLDSGARRTLTGAFPYLRELAIHPSDDYLLAVEHYEQYGLWVIDARTGAEITRFRATEDRHFDPPRERWPCWTLDVSDDGSLLARGDDATLFVHEFRTGEIVARLPQELAVKRNGFRATFGGTNDTLLSRVDLGVVSLYRRGAE
jgi:hypothetical protein